MSTRERILTIRLLAKVSVDPGFAKTLGIEAVKEKLFPDRQRDSATAGKLP